MADNQIKSSNIKLRRGTITRNKRERLHQHKSILIWFTGLSGSGKSTLAHALEDRLYQMGCSTYVLDGDNVRHGLSADLGFTEADRQENIRRIANVAKLFTEAGVIVLTAFISPFKADRAVAKTLFPEDDFLEVYCNASLATCEQRDTKGLYRKARAGAIPLFTGISSPYESPTSPDLEIKTDVISLEDSVEILLAKLKANGLFTAKP